MTLNVATTVHRVLAQLSEPQEEWCGLVRVCRRGSALHQNPGPDSDMVIMSLKPLNTSKVAWQSRYGLAALQPRGQCVLRLPCLPSPLNLRENNCLGAAQVPPKQIRASLDFRRGSLPWTNARARDASTLVCRLWLMILSLDEHGAIRIAQGRAHHLPARRCNHRTFV